MKPKNGKRRVLIINTVGMGFEGISMVILNYLRNMSADGLELHITATPGVSGEIREILESLGTMHIIPQKQENLKGYLQGIRTILKNGIDVIHIHGNSGTMAMEVLLARLCGVRRILVHGHSTKTDHPLVHAVLKYPMMMLAHERIACSEATGNWLYGRFPHKRLNNAVKLDGFLFREDLRKQYREEFGLKNEFLIGHIGHFTEPKNHFFLIDVFAAFHRMEPDSKLLLVSDGPRFRKVKEKVTQLGLQDAVIFAGRRSDVAGIYSAMDLFILPSCWEGLPLVMVEAQMNGLPLLVSDVVTKAAKCTDRVCYKPLEDGAESWAESLRTLRKKTYDRETDYREVIAEKGFDIQTEAAKLRDLYLKDC